MRKNFFDLMDDVSRKHIHETYGEMIFKGEQSNKTILFVGKDAYEPAG